MKLLAVITIFILSTLCPDITHAGTKKTIRSPLAFDITTRQTTKIRVNQWLSFSGYVGLSYLGEQNLKLDDGLQDSSEQSKIYTGIAVRARLTARVTGFARLEFVLKHKKSHAKSYGALYDTYIKEVLISANISKNTAITLGHLRFSDQNKWVVDKAVDGVHFRRRGENQAFEFALFKDDYDNDSTYALAHFVQFKKNRSTGVFAIAERAQDASLFHLTGYFNRQINSRFGYSLNIAGLASNRVNTMRNGFGFDLTATQKISTHNWKPEINFGLAFGSKGFRQTRLQSNKTNKGGQMLSYQYGYVYEPELTNIGIASLSIGLRPRRSFSMDLKLFAYLQASKQVATPLARISGVTNGTSAYLGTEISLVGAWRPNKKSKIQFGVGMFKPGSAYINHPIAKRLYFSAARYF